MCVCGGGGGGEGGGSELVCQLFALFSTDNQKKPVSLGHGLNKLVLDFVSRKQIVILKIIIGVTVQMFLNGSRHEKTTTKTQKTLKLN